MSRLRVFALPAAAVLAAAVTMLVTPAATAWAGVTGPSVSPSANPTAYVGVEGNECNALIPIDTATGTAETAANIGPSCSTYEEPYALTVSPNGGTVYAVTGLANGDTGDGRSTWSPARPGARSLSATTRTASRSPRTARQGGAQSRFGWS
jgi:hypothetical protein